MSNETTIKVKASPDGQNYTIEIVEEEAKNGDRIDQKTARAILQMDETLKSPQFMQAYQQQMQGQQMRRSMPPQMGFPAGGMFPPPGGNMGFPPGGMY